MLTRRAGSSPAFRTFNPGRDSCRGFFVVTMQQPFLWIPIGALVAGAIAVGAFRARFLTRSGAWAAFALGAIVFGLGGLQFSIPLIVFFTLSSLLSVYGPKRWKEVKERLGQVFEKGGTRDAWQVWANGGIAGIIVILYVIQPHECIFVAYLGALAAAAADTWGTELGVLSRGRTISARTFRTVEPGVSGGISAVGTLGAAAGAASVALSGMYWSAAPRSVLGVAILAGLAGMLADSLTGAILQARYRCVRCHGITERRFHCDRSAKLVAGRPWVTNDLVNTVCCIVGASLAYLLCTALS